MTKISAEVILKSKNEFGNTITTMVVTFPRFILAELNTHRMFSRNSASSRAIPFKKMIRSVMENPFVPIAWQKEHTGMQGTEYFNDYSDVAILKEKWLVARNRAVASALDLASGVFDQKEVFEFDENGELISKQDKVGVTKQLCNRLLEPFMWHTVIITATEWENFFALRCPQYQIFDSRGPNTFRSKKDAIKFAPDLLNNGIKTKPLTELEWLSLNKGQSEIHMMALAEAMWDAYNEASVQELKAGEWHIPFGDKINQEALDNNIESYGPLLRVKIATARCARISYTVVGEEDKKLIDEITQNNIVQGLGHKWETEDYKIKQQKQYQKDIELHDRLAASGHASPFEHCAKTMDGNEYATHISGKCERSVDDPNHLIAFGNTQGWSGNFRGFIQYRKMFPNENIV